MKKHGFPGLIFALFLCPPFAIAQTLTQGIAPQRIVLNLTADPAHGMAVTWRTNAEVKHPLAQVAVSGDWTEFQGNVQATKATSEKVRLDTKAVGFSHSAILDGLKPNQTYAYRVGGDSVWSEWNQFTTAKDERAPFDFVFLGDPQYEIKNLCSRIFRQALITAPGAKFWLLTGDLMDLPQYDRFWVEWFSATGFIHSIVPSIVAPGSHEYALKTGSEVRWDVFCPTWNAHFTFPRNGPKGSEEKVYYIDYQGVRFVILDSQMALKEQSEWLESVLGTNPNKWTIAAFHEPVFSIAKDRDERHTRDAFMPLIDKYSVDLVLTGHDHGYARSKKLRGGRVVGENEHGTIYIVSVCGPKSYDHNPQYDSLMVKTGVHQQLFQVISMQGNRLMYKSYSVTGKLNDSFELEKQ
ncbi:MAG: metallophosphoesterase family protein [Bacteroidota bacterium]